MPTVEQISESRIRRVLDRKKFSHRIDDDGDIVGVLSADEDCPYSVLWYIRLEGKNKGLFVIRLLDDRVIPDRDHGRAVLACNKWNKEKRWPKTFLAVGSDAQIIGEEQIDLETGIHDELLADYIATMISAGWSMFVTLSKEGL